MWDYTCETIQQWLDLPDENDATSSLDWDFMEGCDINESWDPTGSAEK